MRRLWKGGLRAWYAHDLEAARERERAPLSALFPPVVPPTSARSTLTPGAVAQGVQGEDWWAAVRVGRSCKSVQCKVQGTEWQHGGGAVQGGS